MVRRYTRLISVWVTEEMYEKINNLRLNEKGTLSIAEVVRNLLEKALGVS
ncbi:MAG: hypothetical protein QXG39_08730 [Candidatus Aenigmatarchaeota archaeon]